MKRRIVWVGVALVCASMMGCKMLDHQKRSNSDDPTEAPIPEKKADSEPSESIAPKGFFKPSRLPGALSDEAREVESHLGIQ